MKRFLITTILTALVAFGLEWLLPWWIIAIVPFVFCAFVLPKPGQAFLSGFLAIGLMWAGTAAWRMSEGSPEFVAALSEVITLPPQASWFFLVTVFVGALIGGLSGLSGALLARMRS
ncbi:MAG: hypothetical protein ACT6QS_09035 [Flavobacteriales bacterium]